MNVVIDAFTVISVVIGCFFFITGNVALFRLPDTLSRLHALTKVDNAGLGFILLGLLPQAPTLLFALKLLLVWLLVLITSSAMGTLIAESVTKGPPID